MPKARHFVSSSSPHHLGSSSYNDVDDEDEEPVFFPILLISPESTVVTIELPYMSVERRGLTASGAINYHPDTVVANGDRNNVPISTVFGGLRDMLACNGGSNFTPRTGESPICRPPPVIARSLHMFDESLGLTGSGVTKSSDGRVVTRPKRTTVPISTVFGRFKDMTVSSAEVNSTADTDADLRGSTRCGSYVLINNRSHNFVDEAHPSPHADFSPAYMNLRDCHCECRHCGGLFWYNERLKRRQYSRHLEYHLCCGRGKFYMHLTPDPPPFIQQLLRNAHFMENIRAYNHMFSMMSFGAKVDELVNLGMGPYVFNISGQIYHWIGSLCPEDDDHPRFLQMYIYDTNNKVKNRMRYFRGLDALGLNPEIVEGLIHVFDEHNGLVRLFRTTRDRCSAGEIPRFKIWLYNLGGVCGYELSTSDVLGAIVFEDGPRSRIDFDEIIEFRGGPPKRINKLHQSYMSLQFPLLFVFGQPRFYPKLILKPRNGRGEGRKVTMNAYYKYQLLFCAIEQSQLDFIRKRQKDLRSDCLSGLYDAISRGDRWEIMVGSIILLPCSFIGGPRVFQHKVKDLVKFLKEVKTFGRVVAVLYTIEFQKRGMPHCHTLLWVDSKNKITDASQIDEYIPAELPDPVKDMRGYKVVYELMLHGSCGAVNLSAPCMQNGTCNKKIPKRFNANTFFDSNGRTQYRQRDTGTYFMKPESRLDNCNVVLYNRVLCLAFEAYINVEYCGWKWKKTTPTEWFVYNNENTDGRHLTYLSFPSEFVWYADSKQWKRRQIVSKKSLGRLTYVHLSSGELFYLRVLMSHQKGFKSPTDVRIVNCKIFPTYRAACEALGLLGDDKEWDISFQESAFSATSSEMRTLFAQILIYCDVADLGFQTIVLTTLKGYILYELKAILNGFGKCVKDFGLQPPPDHLLKDLENKLHMEEKNYNRELLMQDAIRSVPKLNCKQNNIYDLIMNVVTRNKQELLFVYGHGGTRKTFLWETIISSLRSQGKIVLALASSGIASLLLSAGRTAHSRFKLPLKLTDESLCHVKKNTQLGKLLVETNLIIWDEAPMNDRRCFETLDRTLRDLMSSPDLIFGGKTVVLGESYLWWNFKICMLTVNIRLLRSDLNAEQQQWSEVFSKWLLDIGNGETGDPDNEDDQNNCWISIPPEYYVSSDDEGMSEPIDFIYDQTTLKTPTAEALQEKAIVCPKNDTADAVNAKILSLIEGRGKTYLSKDQAIPMGKEASEIELLYPMEYLNTINFPENTIGSLKIGQAKCILEARVYRKWVSKSFPQKKEIAFRCILIDKENNAIQANMDVNNTDYFNPLPQLQMVYRITNFICENTKPYPQTLESLKFGKITSFHALLEKQSEFPEHHFEFIAYNQLSSRVPYRDENSKTIYPMLTDYLECIRSISDIMPFGDANKGQGWLRKVDIENLDGNVVEFTMWDDLAK
nr:DNA helicase [Tanacetum cinerariifolium]